ncbi:MAG: RHS repeat-associated core domain-containing protein, partial [Planctomycetota bacterium]
MPTTNYLWDPLNDSYLMETDDSGATTAVYTQEPAHYGGLVSQYQASVASYFHQDNLGSTRVLTDDAGTATDAFAYDAWGMGIARTGSTETAFQWIGNKGYYFDYEQELYHVRVRSYRPISSRWMTLDPLLNMRLLYYYTYCNNSPTAAIDPSGYKCETIDANKVRYVPGRGEFTSVAMRTGEPEDDVDPTGLDLFSDFKATWKGYESVTSNAFFDNPGRKSCCCCREVGFIQIVQIKGIRGERKRDAIYSGALDITWNYGKSHSWKIDGGIPYPFGEKSRPCSVYSDKFLKSQYPNAIIT